MKTINVELIRGIDTGIETTGVLYITGDETFFCDTLELPYKNNERKISCIPTGKYLCKKVGATTSIPYEHVAIEVPGRDGICIHAGNTYAHTKGCILVGKTFGDINKDGYNDVLYSKPTLAELMKILPEVFMLKISE